MNLRIGTRGSALARAQTADVARRLEALGHTIETVVISTAGDRTTDRPFAEVGAFGVFVREIENALLDRRIDLAVHSYKDLPSKGPDSLVIAAVPERVDVADVLLINPLAFDEKAEGFPLRKGAIVGTSAARRQALLRQSRPDLDVGLLRGNVPTRVRALAEGRFDAIVLAAAGILRLERADPASLMMPEGTLRVRLNPRSYVPAPAQGAVAVQVCRHDEAVFTAVSAIDDPRTARALAAERALLGLAEAGCNQAFGAWCDVQPDGALVLVAVLEDESGVMQRIDVRGTDPAALASEAWTRFEWFATT